MKKRSKLFGALLAGALLMVTVPMVAYGDDGDGRGSGRDDRDSGRDLDVVAVTADGRLIEFETDDPGDADTIGTIRGLVQDTKLVGIDYRPASGSDGDNGDLYGLGDKGGVYVISDDNAQATLRTRLTVALSGASFGVDFNPAVDRLRVISDTGQNLRVNVDTGETLVDGTLGYPGPPPMTATGRHRRRVHE